MNVCTFIGRTGAEATLRYTANSTPVLGFRLAVDVGWGQNKETLWLDVSLWGKRGEALDGRISKGAQLAVSGELSTREHNGKTYLQLKANELKMLDGKPQGQQDQQQDSGGFRNKPAEQPKQEEFKDDDIPF